MTEKIVRIFLGREHWVDIPTPEDFNMPAFCNQIRDVGYYYDGGGCYVPYAAMKLICWIERPADEHAKGVLQ